MAGIPPGTPPRRLRDPSREAQNIDFSKILGMASPGVEYVPTSLETIFKLSRGPQRPYIEKSENFENFENLKKSEIRPPYSPGLGPSYFAAYLRRRCVDEEPRGSPPRLGTMAAAVQYRLKRLSRDVATFSTPGKPHSENCFFRLFWSPSKRSLGTPISVKHDFSSCKRFSRGCAFR